MKKINKTALNTLLKSDRNFITGSNVLIIGERWYIVSIGEVSARGFFPNTLMSLSKKPFLIDINDFLQFMDTVYNHKSIELKNNALHVSGDVNYIFPVSFDTEPYPEPVEIGNRSWFTFPAEAIADLKRFVSTDRLRPAMHGININGELCATNGHILRTAQAPLHIPGEKPFIFPATAAKLIDARGDYAYTFTPDNSGGSEKPPIMHVKNLKNGIILTVKTVPETFPNYKAVIPMNNNKQAEIPRQQLLQFCQTIAKQRKNDGERHVSFEFENDVLTLKNKDSHSDAVITKQIPVKTTRLNAAQPEKINLLIGFNARYIVECIKNSKKDTVIFNMSIDSRAALIDEDTLCMPVMLLNDYQ